MTLARELYRHRQFGWLIMGGTCGPLVLLFALLPHATGRASEVLPQALVPALFGLGVCLVLLFGALEVCVTTDALEWRFGVGLIRGRVPLADITAIKAVRTRVANGWGIRRTARGWLYNVSGFDALEVEQKSGKVVLIGTNDLHTLRQALAHAIDHYSS
jgi:hypothetical protein